jgi:hypothetical protein
MHLHGAEVGAGFTPANAGGFLPGSDPRVLKTRLSLFFQF